LQWTFLLGINWEGYRDYKSIKFYRLDSTDGKQLIDKLSYTKAERQRVQQQTLLEYHSYNEYLATPEFKRVRAQVMARAGESCERCHGRPPTEPHHLQYPKWGTLDVPENMIAVCHECHCELHGKEN